MQARWYQEAAKQSLIDYYRSTPSVVEGVIRKRNPLVCMPTGTGKSFCIGDFTATALKTFPNTRVLMMTHVKELIEQNAKTILRVWPECPLGIFSSGLRKKQVAPVTYAGVMSIKGHLDKLGRIDFTIIDEAHLLSPSADATYQDILRRLTDINPYMSTIGFTATPYRLGIGSLTNNGIFTDTAIDLTTLEAFNRLVNEGYIAPLVTKRRGNIAVDLSNVGVQNGEYRQSELQQAADQTDLTNAIVLDILNNAIGIGRRCGLIFASGIEHSQHISECFAHYGVEVPAVHSKMDSEQRNNILRDYKAGRYWALVNNNILTTGFDHPAIDFIACIRPTTSTGLWVQMLGRGTRPSIETGKINCLVHDYAGNTERLGPINDPIIPKLKRPGAGEAPTWCCDMCGTYNHARAPFCTECGFAHDMSGGIDDKAGTQDVMISEQPIIEMFEVNRVVYRKHIKSYDPEAPPTLRVVYQCGLFSFSEYIALESTHPAALRRASEWWQQRVVGSVPTTIDQALLYSDQIKWPSRVNVHTNLKYPRIVGVEF